MNLVRSIIVPHTIASDTAQKTNSKNHLASAAAAMGSSAATSATAPAMASTALRLPRELFRSVVDVGKTFTSRLMTPAYEAAGAAQNVRTLRTPRRRPRAVHTSNAQPGWLA